MMNHKPNTVIVVAMVSGLSRVDTMTMLVTAVGFALYFFLRDREK